MFDRTRYLEDHNDNPELDSQPVEKQVKIYQTVKVIKVYEGAEAEVNELMGLDYQAVKRAAGQDAVVVGNQVYSEDIEGEALEAIMRQYERVLTAREVMHKAVVGSDVSISHASESLHAEIKEFRRLVMNDSQMVNLVLE